MVQVTKKPNGETILFELKTQRELVLQPQDSEWLDETTPQDELVEFFN